MPGKDEKQNKQPNEQPNKQPNDYYFSYMGRADGWLKEGFREARFSRSISKEFENLRKENAMKWIARAIALAEIAEREGFKELSEDEDLDTDALDEEAKKRSEEIKNSAQFQAVIGSMSGEEIYYYLGRKEEGKKYPDTPIKFTEFAQKYAERKKELAREVEQEKRAQAQRQRLGDLVTDLEHSTQKSIFGKIKSIFVGNSQQYKNALGAMKALSEGKIHKKENMNKAKKAIKDYIFARGDKVRDHQYGRDRFDAFMKGLGEIMEPQEFVALCRDVNSARREYYGRDTDRTVDPVEYMATDEKKKIMRAAWEADYSRERREERKATIDSLADRKEEEEARKEEEQKKAEEGKLKKEAEKKGQGIKKDEERIRNDTKVKDIKGEQTGMNLMERCQKDLDRLRRYTADQLVYEDQGMGIRKGISNRLFMHPAFRVVAEPIIKEKRMQELFKYPPVQRDKMNPDVVKQLDAQVKELKELDLKIQQDRMKQQNLNNKPVEVGGPQPGGGGIGLGG